MHFPQLPDPNGWDVSLMQPRIIADDWLCTGTGPVSDIHGWISVQEDADLIAESFNRGIYSERPQTKPSFSVALISCSGRARFRR